MFSLAKENYRSKTHALLLYPDCPEHVIALEKLQKSYDCAYILHDKDKNENGELKKAHWHVVIRCQNQQWRSAICKDIGIEENYCDKIRSFENALQYLIHYNDSDKAQYSVDEVKGNLQARLKESLLKNEKSEGEKVCELIEFIECTDGFIKVSDFAKYCAMNGYWSEFRRSGSIFMAMIKEHNESLYKN